MSKSINQQQIIEEITHKITLNLFKVGCDTKNYNMLIILPQKTPELEIKMNLTKMPLNRRLNELVKVGLIERDLYKGDVKPTELTKVFINHIKDLEKEVMKQIPKLLG
ncbi:hypothetical protein J4476_03125 [Candidatus Woesearchaeota archaeon]|nr:hypothetical protein [Candidatus Woesearchaeota archaeon]HIH25771.1 hypothetical protein [Nanoarchaeota archaeon]